MIVTIKAGRAAGSVVIPPSKSVAHRLLINAAMCAGESTLFNLPTNEDIAATVDCLRAMGAQITLDGKGNCTVRGFGGRALFFGVTFPLSVDFCRFLRYNVLKDTDYNGEWYDVADEPGLREEILRVLGTI